MQNYDGDSPNTHSLPVLARFTVAIADELQRANMRLIGVMFICLVGWLPHYGRILNYLPDQSMHEKTAVSGLVEKFALLAGCQGLQTLIC